MGLDVFVFVVVVVDFDGDGDLDARSLTGQGIAVGIPAPQRSEFVNRGVHLHVAVADNVHVPDYDHVNE